MYALTRGIVFRQIKYSDSSLVVKIFTEEFGLQSYLIKGARGPKSRMKPSLFQPLSLLEIVVTMKAKGELHHIREARSAFPFRSVPFRMDKTSILIFMNEILFKSIQEEARNREMFGFVYEAVKLLDQTDENISHFHLLFSLHLTRFLGIFPHGAYSDEKSYFDMMEGTFERGRQKLPDHYIAGDECMYFHQILNCTFKDLQNLSIPAPFRKKLLDNILLYYSLHLPMAKDFQSHLILHEVLQK